MVCLPLIPTVRKQWDMNGAYTVLFYRMSLAQNWRRRGMFDEVAFVFPNAPMIPITVVCHGSRFSVISVKRNTDLKRIIGGCRTLVWPCLDGMTLANLVAM